MNNVSLIGRIVATPELKTTTSGKNVTNFTLAVKGYGDSSDFIDVVAWNKTAELVCQYIEKGRELGVTGRISVRSYEHDGQKRKAVEVVADSVTFLGGKKQDESNNNVSGFEMNGTTPVSAGRDNAPTEIDDSPVDLSEIPF